MTKTCKVCGAIKERDLFPRAGLECKACASVRVKAWVAANRARMRDKQRAWRANNAERKLDNDRAWVASNWGRRKEYGWRAQGIELTYDQYLKILEAQGGKCLLCRRAHAKLCVDHCHTTGRIRGILCDPCNRGIGLLGDSPELLEKAAGYLRDKGKVDGNG